MVRQRMIPPLWMLAALVVGQSMARTTASPQESHHLIAFPGENAFGVISGLRKNSSAAAVSAADVTTAGGASGCPAEGPEFGWSNQSPFLESFPSPSGRGQLIDVRLAVDTMFRLSSSLESQLRDPSATNLLFSPLGLTSVLGQLLLAARGRTADQLGTLLAGSALASCHFHPSFRAILAQVWSRRGSESHELSVANAVFHQKGLPVLNRDFVARLAGNYAAETFPTDFRKDPISAQQHINQWASRASKGKIKQLMPVVPPPTTTAIISSVTHFKAKWENQFSKQFTSKSTFYIDGDYRGRTKAIDFMSGEFEVPYAESKALGCKMVVLPYTNNETAMYLIMPLGHSKWKGPRPLLPLLVAHRDKDEDPLTTQSTTTNQHSPPQPLNGAYSAASSQRTYYDAGNGRPTRVPNGNLPPQPYGYIYQRTSNPQRLRRRQVGGQQEEATYGFDPSYCQEHPCQRGQTESPFSGSKLHQLANHLGAEQFNALVASAKEMRVSLFIPKLSMTSNVKLREALATLGVAAVFGEGSDLSGAVNQTEGDAGTRWAVDEVWQQSLLDVNEEGTEAASGTAAVIVDYSLDSAIFKANSPFLAIIRHEATGTPVFWASVGNPS